LAGALEVERNVMFIILTMILLVAALNIVSGLIMLVRDKGRDIAVLRSMGASRGMIMRVFFITGASIGVVGTLAGLVAGVVFSTYIEEIRQFLIWATGANLFPAEVYFLERMPALILPADVAQIALMALTLSFLSTLYPAWRAAAQEPVELLRNE
jgi:lipoprotein-releasing system permease protein